MEDDTTLLEEDINPENNGEINDEQVDSLSESLALFNTPLENNEKDEILNDIKVDVEKAKSRKSKKNKELNDSNSLSDDILNDPNKLALEFNSFLEDVVGIKDIEEIKLVIPTGIDILDTILGGGIVVGGICILAGLPGSFKSVLAAQIIAQAQRIFSPLLAQYLDSEESMTSLRLSQLGIRNPKINPKTNITLESVFKILEAICVFKEVNNITNPAILCLDSLANTLCKKEIEAEDMKEVIGYRQKLLSFLLPKYVSKCSKYNISFIIVNQLRDKISMGPYGPSADLKFMSNTRSMSGGMSLKHNAFQLLEMQTKSVLDPEKYGGMNGVIVNLKAVKNKFFPPNITVELLTDFNKGFSNFWTNYNFLVNTKRIKSGAWNSLINFPENKFRTKEAEELYNTNNDFKSKYDELVKLAIQQDYIDTYKPIIE